MNGDAGGRQQMFDGVGRGGAVPGKCLRSGRARVNFLPLKKVNVFGKYFQIYLHKAPTRSMVEPTRNATCHDFQILCRWAASRIQKVGMQNVMS